MSNYPFDTFPLTKRIGIVNPVANLDARYGPWPTFNDALTGFNSAVRERGLTVAVSGIGGIVEYWYRNGITNNDLILKTVEETGFKGLSGKYEDVSTAFIANSANYVLDGGNTKNAALSVGTTNNFGLILETNNISRVTITSAGNVGIGTINPNQILTVVGNISSTNILYSRLGNSNQWQDNYTFTQTNSGNWQQKVLILPSNLPANTVNTFSVTEYGVAYQTVSNDQFYTFTADFTEDRTLTLFISGNHQSIKRHRITFSGPFNLQINGSGQSNMFYTFNKHTTKVTLTRLTGALNTNFLGTAEIIRTDLNENQGGLGFVTLETITGPTDFLLQEDGDRLVIRNFT